MRGAAVVDVLRRWLGPVLLVPIAWIVAIAAVTQDKPAARWHVDEVRAERWTDSGWTPFEQRLPIFLGDYEIDTRRVRVLVPYEPRGADAAPNALLLQRVGTPLRVVHGDVVIAELPGATKRGCARGNPLLLNLPRARAGVPVEIELSIPPDCAFLLDDAYLGPLAALLPHYASGISRRLLGREAIVTTALLLALIVLAIWRRRPHDTAYAYFAVGLAAWAAFNFGIEWDARPAGINGWQALLHVCLAYFVASMTVFVHRFEGRRFPRGERALWIGTALTSLALLVLAPRLSLDAFLGPVMTAHRVLLVVVGSYMAWRLLRFAMRNRGSAARWLLAGQTTALSFGINDMLMHLGVIESPLRSAIGYGLPVVLSVFGAILASRFADALRDAEASNRELDAKVREKSRALESEFARTRELERDSVLAGERERVMRDMHDGVGGQLVTLLAQVRGGNATPELLEGALVESLDDLRLIIDSMDRESGELSLALGMLRQRMEPRLVAANLAVTWDTARLPDGLLLGPEGTLNVLRVVQEAAQNVVKHAHARHVAVRARIDAATTPVAMLELTVADDGAGVQSARPGRGLGNLRRRALALGGEFTLTRENERTVARLRVPLPATAPSDEPG